ncbi:uncharacterized protein AKAME5_002018200 [Lates japonicus]|uniref:Ig-like domain-containing protein n=1 Tax=Lates japonicus TaxID=270547 RepID=A0AAD3NCS7_LATJO|nr:uncharacterized protein AKAME5_002018200 [Lates japonicus]
MMIPEQFVSSGDRWFSAPTVSRVSPGFSLTRNFNSADFRPTAAANTATSDRIIRPAGFPPSLQDGLGHDLHRSPGVRNCGGTRLLVHGGEEADCDEDDDRHHQNETKGSSSSIAPSVQVLWSVPSPQDPGSPHLLVCVLSGFKSPVQEVLWWVGDTVVTSAATDVSLMRSEKGVAYSAMSVWEVSAADWKSGSTYSCGTVQKGRVYRQKLCSED